MLPQHRWRVTSAHSVDHISPATAISLIEDINPARAAVQQFLEAQTGRFDAVVAGDPHRAALKLLANLTQREALVLTYNDLLLLLGALFVFGLILLPLVRRPRSFFGH